MILAQTNVAGAEMIDATIKWPPMSGMACSTLAYRASTPTAMVAKPPTMTLMSSDRVILARNGRTSSGASVWPRKMFPAVHTVSAPLVPSVFCIAHATPFTTSCSTPK